MCVCVREREKEGEREREDLKMGCVPKGEVLNRDFCRKCQVFQNDIEFSKRIITTIKS